MSMYRVIAVLLFFAFSLSVEAADTAFREEFIRNYKESKFEEQARLVQKSKSVIPEEIGALLRDALTKDVNERNYLLNIANIMAYMYHHWHGKGEKLIDGVQAVINEEIRKEDEKVAELMKWKKEERFVGNIVLKANMGEMQKKDLNPVLYPHWFHRIMFQCRVCHDKVFAMNRWENKITHAEMSQGRQCGLCHDGKISFGVDEQCERCHIAGKPEAASLYDIKKIDYKKIKDATAKIGGFWDEGKLQAGKMPLDKFQFIDWMALKNKNVFRPLASLSKDKESTHEIRDNKILFETKNKSVGNVLFSHKSHSDWINCSSCHPTIFKDKLGSNDVRMADMSNKMMCGYCHGRVSFTFANCPRCHNKPSGDMIAGALRRGIKTKE